MSDLRERVARAIAEHCNCAMNCTGHLADADAALTVALEEAARIFDEMWGGITPDEAAATIRALIPKAPESPEQA